MIGFEIYINDEKPIIMASDHVVSVILGYGYPLGSTISLIGRDCSNDLTWLKGKPEIGDKIIIKVIETDEVSPCKKTKCDSMNNSKLNFKRKDLYRMKGIIVKYKDIVCKAGIPHCGTLFTADITWHSGAYWSVGGLKMPEEVHFIWNGSILEVGDVIEVEVAEFDEASAPVSEEKHSSLIEKMSERVEDYSKDLELYYQLKKILEDENLIEVVDD